MILSCISSILGLLALTKTSAQLVEVLVNPLTPNNFLHDLSYSSRDVSLENLVLDQLILY